MGGGPASDGRVRRFSCGCLRHQVAVGHKKCPDLAPRIEDGLVHRVSADTETRGQDIEGIAIDHRPDEQLSLPLGEHHPDGTPHRGDGISCFDMVAGLGGETHRQCLPLLGVDIERKGTVVHTPALELVQHLEHDELVHPGGEPALAAVGAQFGENRQQRVGRSLMRHVVEFHTHRRCAATVDLVTGDLQEHGVEFLDRNAIRLTTPGAQADQPLRRTAVPRGHVRHRRLPRPSRPRGRQPCDPSSPNVMLICNILRNEQLYSRRAGRPPPFARRRSGSSGPRRAVRPHKAATHMF
ncbi:hypothetical protein MSMEI_3191 [Mycolicibacterium smegmatis MC2 155]|uniref:Uncharacterized protein n=1 Tax=Mycolicibacterium smegmatis (strain ATCC 700084 / mc(2)155) TaxID=246196 RepID=I7GAV4_MYCS2|nr:hypothetical protein MSMEI_3191 [Mycolicibacterium smegmatis MC2 155]